MIIKSLAVIGLIALTSTSVFAVKIYNCTAMRNGSSTGQTVSITVMNSQGGSDAEVKAAAEAWNLDAFVFQQKRSPGKPMWDSGVRDALHQAAEAENCDFEGLGPHSFRRANITWRCVAPTVVCDLKSASHVMALMVRTPSCITCGARTPN